MTVAVGVIFGMVTALQYRRTRALAAAIELVKTIQTPAFAESIQLILKLPEDADPKLVSSNAGTVSAAYIVSHAFESLGVLVFYRLLPLHLVDRLIGGYVRASWKRLKPHVEAHRVSFGVMFGEWFQWLAERMIDNPAPGKEVGAASAYRAWTYRSGLLRAWR
jgi:hypothetical protein